MPWTDSDYPDSMKNLPVEVRHKAIEIANALLEEERLNESIAIATAISRAKDWAINGDKKAGKGRAGERKDADRNVFPANGYWTIQKDSAEKPESVEDTKEDAVKKARVRAKKDQAGLTVRNKQGRVEEHISFNTGNSDPK